VERNSLAAMSGRSLLPFLRGLADRLLDILTADEPDPAGSYRVGGALVDAHFTEVAALQRTMAVLGTQLSGGAAARPGGAGRLASTTGLDRFHYRKFRRSQAW